MLQVDIRRPNTQDIRDLNDFFRIVVTDTFIKEGIGEKLADIEEEITSKEQHLLSDLESSGENNYFLIAVYEGKVIGTIEIGPVNEIIRSTMNDEAKGLAELGSVFVHPAYQRKGIGNSLLNAMHAEMSRRGVNVFVLDSGYKTAQQIWMKKFGEPAYLLKDYWGEGYDHMIWKTRFP